MKHAIEAPHKSTSIENSSDNEIVYPDENISPNQPQGEQPKRSPTASRPRVRAKRRLTLTAADSLRTPSSSPDDMDTEAERGLIHGIDASTIKVASPLFRGRKRWSVGTETDGHRRESFCDKSTSVKGHKFCPSASGVGYACKKGLKPVSPNQDSFLIIRVEGGVSVYGVFDGHGRVGHDVSNFCKDQIARLLFESKLFTSGSDIPQALKSAFATTQSLLEQETRAGRLDATSSGTTATVVVQRPDELFVAHVGDSRCVLTCRSDPSAVYELTIDHKPQIPAERERIIANGGVVIKPPADVNHRVYVKNQKFPGLAMSRALGDLVGYFGAGISAEPDVCKIDLTEKEWDTLVLCSDGVWEFVTNEECAEMVSEFSAGCEMKAAEALCKDSWDRWIKEENGYIVDDITALVVSLK